MNDNVAMTQNPGTKRSTNMVLFIHVFEIPDHTYFCGILSVTAIKAQAE